MLFVFLNFSSFMYIMHVRKFSTMKILGNFGHASRQHQGVQGSVLHTSTVLLLQNSTVALCILKALIKQPKSQLTISKGWQCRCLRRSRKHLCSAVGVSRPTPCCSRGPFRWGMRSLLWDAGCACRRHGTCLRELWPLTYSFQCPFDRIQPNKRRFWGSSPIAHSLSANRKV